MPEPYQPGDWVMILRPKSSLSEAKAETWWEGPMKVVRRVGEASYEVERKPGITFATHVDRMKTFVRGPGVELFHWLSNEGGEEVAPKEWNVEKILAHRWVRGKPQFLTRWEGFEPAEDTWEPVGNFIHRYSYK